MLKIPDRFAIRGFFAALYRSSFFPQTIGFVGAPCLRAGGRSKLRYAQNPRMQATEDFEH
jgi:hypothetical protein